MSASKAPAFKAALYTACQGLYGSLTTLSGDYTVGVFYGIPTSYSDEMVLLEDMTSEQEVAAMGSGRPRWETLTLTGTVMCYLGGTDQQSVTERAYYLLGLLETYLQDAGNIPSTQITLGGAVLQSRVTGHELTETANDDDAEAGRSADIEFTVTALVRI